MKEDNKDIDVREFKTWDDWSEWNKDHPIQMEDYKIIQQTEHICIYAN